MFPYISLQSIQFDMIRTRSAEATAENILEGRLGPVAPGVSCVLFHVVGTIHFCRSRQPLSLAVSCYGW